MSRYGRRLLAAGIVLAFGLLVPAYLVGRDVPAPLAVARVGLAGAKKMALAAVGGGQVLTAAPTMRRRQPVYGFTIRSSAGRLWSVSVDQQTAKVIRGPAPAGGVIGLNRAVRLALARVPGSHAIAWRVVTKGHRRLDQVTLAGPGDTRDQVWITPASGVVVRMVRGAPNSPPTAAGGGSRLALGASGTISPAAAGKIAVQAVGGGHVLSVTRSEPTDRATFTYRVKVLLPTSMRVDVKVTETGAVLRVHGEGGA